MRACDFQLGQRVRRRDETFALRSAGTLKRGRRIGVVTELPDTAAGRWTVLVQWEGRNMRAPLTESIRLQRLEALAADEQPIELGGSWTPPAGWCGFSLLAPQTPAAPAVIFSAQPLPQIAAELASLGSIISIRRLQALRLGCLDWSALAAA